MLRDLAPAGDYCDLVLNTSFFIRYTQQENPQERKSQQHVII
jgi:hypothetical protein